ncbi:hypothetical protein Bhyg_04330 [Pseudolycoriella hygida]|uniref:Uncharacterized protein n=1 Tax=Pseudolycoriella hygida TaxID=35572 RepID=A0A9Q0NF28_9DIPT|nr:hypothetical protein Bhyg_04330 [Pseudolycoriella hygida]
MIKLMKVKRKIVCSRAFIHWIGYFKGMFYRQQYITEQVNNLGSKKSLSVFAISINNLLTFIVLGTSLHLSENKVLLAHEIPSLLVLISQFKKQSDSSLSAFSNKYVLRFNSIYFELHCVVLSFDKKCIYIKLVSFTKFLFRHNVYTMCTDACQLDIREPSLSRRVIDMVLSTNMQCQLIFVTVFSPQHRHFVLCEKSFKFSDLIIADCVKSSVIYKPSH